MEEAYAALGGIDEFMGGVDEKEHKYMMLAIAGFVGAIIVILVLVLVYVVVKIFGCKSSGFASFRQRRSKQGVAYKTQPPRFQDTIHSYPHNSQNAFLNPRLAIEDAMMDHDSSRFVYDNVEQGMVGGPSSNKLSSVEPYEENIRPSYKQPVSPSRLQNGNHYQSMESLLYQD